VAKFENVSVTVKANVYFDGKVTSRAITFADGSTKTLGIMLPGDYEFGTEAAELMEITAGQLQVLLPNEADWQTVVGGESFNVPAQAKFKLKVEQVTDYICTYLPA
jgi:uncharacterized protein YaiE (UPF0345 family)